MNPTAFVVSGYFALYICAMVVAAVIINACEKLPERVSPAFLAPKAPGNAFLLGLASFLFWFGLAGIAAILSTVIESELSLVVAICAGVFSLIRYDSESAFR